MKFHNFVCIIVQIRTVDCTLYDCRNCPSALVRQISVSPMVHDGLSRTDREPHMHKTSDFTKEKLSLVRRKQVASLVVMFLFSAIFSARCLKKAPHSRLIPPKHENTSGVKLPCSTSITISAYLIFFSFSCFSWILPSGLMR